MINTPLCTVCRNAEMTGARATFTVCQTCVDWLHHQLEDIARLWAQLPDFLERGRGHSGPRVTGNTAVAGSVPLAEHVLDLIAPGGVPDRLSAHDVAIRTARGLPATLATGSTDHRFTTALHNLDVHLTWATANLDLHSLALALQQIVAQMRTATGDRDEPTTTELGTPCARPLSEGIECGGTLRYDKISKTVQCDTCAHLLNTEWYIRLATG